MNRRTIPTFSPEYRLEAAQLVVDQGRSIREAADVMGVAKSTMDKWVRQLRAERDGKSPQGTPMPRINNEYVSWINSSVGSKKRKRY